MATQKINLADKIFEVVKKSKEISLSLYDLMKKLKDDNVSFNENEFYESVAQLIKEREIFPKLDSVKVHSEGGEEISYYITFNEVFSKK